MDQNFVATYALRKLLGIFADTAMMLVSMIVVNVKEKIND
jgi:hypothetical protein